MKIEVIFPDGKRGEVDPQVLQELIDQQQINSFRREMGWVVLGRDRVRRSERKVFCIPERREAELSSHI